MSLILPIFFLTTFLISSLIINFFQLIIFWLIRPYNKSLYRRINYYLIYSSWSQTLGIIEWWAGSYCRVYADEDTFKHFAKEHNLILMNHKYEVDWLVTWMVADRFGVLGGSKCFAKRSLRNLPIIGWAWIFCEMIFLERNWERDSKRLGGCLDTLLEYNDTACLILLFPEGTRYTPEKYEAGVQFSKSHNLPILKHHLLPRTKGYNFCASYLKNKVSAFYNVQLGFPKGTNPNTISLLKGEPIIADLYINRIPIENIPTDSEEASSKFLYDLYHEKDELMENYWKTGVFPGECRVMPRRIWGLVNLIVWSSIVGIPVFYYFLKVFLSGNSTVIMIMSTFILFVFTALYFILRATQVKKGSSYGTTTSSPKKVHISPKKEDSKSLMKDFEEPKTNGVGLTNESL